MNLEKLFSCLGFTVENKLGNLHEVRLTKFGTRMISFPQEFGNELPKICFALRKTEL